MGNIRVRPETGKLQFDFSYRGKRCREQTLLIDTPVNRERLRKTLTKIEAEMTLGTFVYADYFPNSRRAQEFDASVAPSNRTAGDAPGLLTSATPLFKDFAQQWVDEFGIGWRRTYRKGMLGMLRRHLLPRFGHQEVGRIRRQEALQFRAEIAKLPGRNRNGKLNPKTINDIFGLLTMILTEAADRYHFTNPCAGVKRLKVPRTDIAPFTLDEVDRIIREVRPDYRDYMIVRFFTGLRSGELHGLQWRYVDFDRHQILIRETYTHGEIEYTKTDGSQREVDMSRPVAEALKRQRKSTGKSSAYVFCNGAGNPLSTENVTKRVWYPLLRYLGLEPRRPYQTRHTAATLWLASGENPEWIARQLGHTTTEMLFRTYSRYVPNLTRRDGSAFERFVTNALNDATDQQAQS